MEKRIKRVYSRFNTKEYEELRKEAFRSNKRLGELIRLKSLASTLILKEPLTPENKELIRGLTRFGNSLNQIAKALNGLQTPQETEQTIIELNQLTKRIKDDIQN